MAWVFACLFSQAQAIFHIEGALIADASRERRQRHAYLVGEFLRGSVAANLFAYKRFEVSHLKTAGLPSCSRSPTIENRAT